MDAATTEEAHMSPTVGYGSVTPEEISATTSITGGSVSVYTPDTHDAESLPNLAPDPMAEANEKGMTTEAQKSSTSSSYIVGIMTRFF